MAPRWLAPNVKACRSCMAAMKGSQVSAPARLQRRMPATPPSTINPIGPSRTSSRRPCQKSKISARTPSAQSQPIVGSEKSSERQ